MSCNNLYKAPREFNCQNRQENLQKVHYRTDKVENSNLNKKIPKSSHTVGIYHLFQELNYYLHLKCLVKVPKGNNIVELL